MSDAQRRDRHRRLDRHRRGDLPADAGRGLRGRLARAPQDADKRTSGCTRSRSISWTARRPQQAAAEIAGALRRSRTSCTMPASSGRRCCPTSKQDDLQALTQLHLGAAVTLVQAALPAMKSIGFGRIVLMSSRGALGLANPLGLFGHQGRHDRHGAHLGAGACPARHHRQRRRARADPDTEMFRERRSGGQRARRRRLRRPFR